jgi:opacity protein-like surface antigen
MRKAAILMLFALALLPCTAGATSIGVGAFGGMSIPVLQDDNGQGTVMGLRAPVSLLSLVTVEPYYVMGSGGDKDQDIEGTTITRSGLDVGGFGANVLLTFGGKIQFYPFAGIGSYKLSRDGSEDVTNTAYTFGLGLGISPMPKLSIHLRGELAAAVDGETSRKWANATVGVSYNIFSTPIP